MKKALIAGVILAAGASRRLGEPKQLLPVLGEPMLRLVIKAAIHSRLNEVVLVLGCHSDEIIRGLELENLLQSAAERECNFKLIVCEDWEQGASASLKTGIETVSTDMDAAAILLGDQPGVTTELINTVLAAFTDSDRAIARPVYGTASEPSHPVVIQRELFSHLLSLQGDSGARQLMVGRPDEVLAIKLAGKAPRDVDTRDDYAEFCKLPEH